MAKDLMTEMSLLYRRWDQQATVDRCTFKPVYLGRAVCIQEGMPYSNFLPSTGYESLNPSSLKEFSQHAGNLLVPMPILIT